ncbi:amino acid/polyamine transporter I [Phialemonium atrogriseum]|uniref:Amino acid/polyamine transporter I n=1 Tax=Phialemonium atrogriseum TaxID=1093897 RepID=A0AAJ0C2I5_9PEZI|nr:amino acid/polyamine transporter I [Phialemonium atrogriseum]KAK1767913.1 amino acid/polyamine transporter I [Phialemonium atrogriseum]
MENRSSDTSKEGLGVPGSHHETIIGSQADIEKNDFSYNDTNLVLERLGLEPQMKKTLGPFAIACVGFNICNSWVGLAATMVIGMQQGGSVTVIYGMMVTLVGLGCSAATMAELASVYPTAGGPYHWTSILAPKRAHRVLSYSCASLNIFGWLSICSGVTIQPGQFIEAIRIFYNPGFEAPPWQYFLFFQATNIAILVHNILMQRRTSWIHDVGFIFSLTSFFVILVSCVARAPSYNSNEFVWTNFVNNSGWSSGAVVFLTGMANPNFIYAGIDGAVHLAEEVSNAAQAVPRALLSTIVIGFTTAFAFALAMLYSLSDFDKVVEDPTGVPIYEIWYQATRSGAAATTFVVILLLIACFALNACQEVSSRLTWAFARDNALIGSRFLGKIDPTLKVPVWALVANAFVIFIIGCIYLGSSTAFNAFIGSGLLLQQCSFAFPAALLLWHRRSDDVLPKTRSVNLGLFGWLANLVTLLFAPFITIMYCFPIELPVTAATMNYTCAVVGVMFLFSLVNWFLHARKEYKGPRLPQGQFA